MFRESAYLECTNITSRETSQRCDNKGAMKSTNEPINFPTGMIQREADIILCIHYLKSDLSFMAPCNHD